LGAIQAAIHVLRQGAGDDPEIREELLAGVEAEITRLHPLLDDLAQLHGQVLGTLALAPRPVAISDWLPPLLLPWRAAALEKGLQWQAEIPPNLPTLALDPDRMAQVVGNLLSNGIKYTPAGGQLIVAAGVQGQELWLRVEDTGPGIDPAEQAAVFDPFYRSQKLRRFPQGLGLGLTITRDLVQAHGGRLTLASEPGRGSTFTVWLPIMRPLPAG
ncbi:MAG: ATP-binding protein, partial [Anaerolineales bacterium]|nr:ATP-binding protein [Anaerolineales bacterium]